MYLSIDPSIDRSIYRSIHPSIHPSGYLLSRVACWIDRLVNRAHSPAIQGRQDRDENLTIIKCTHTLPSPPHPSLSLPCSIFFFPFSSLCIPLWPYYFHPCTVFLVFFIMITAIITPWVSPLPPFPFGEICVRCLCHTPLPLED